MKNILIVNQKGGVGKSTLADLIMFEYEKAGIPAAFYDLDGQGGVIHETVEDPDAEVAVIDTPGALQEQMGDWIRAADLIIIPTRTTMMDMQPLVRMMEMVQDAPCPVIYVEMAWNRYTTARQFEEWLQEATRGKILRIPQSEKIAQAASAGQSVIDYAPRSAAAQAAREFVENVREMIGI